MKSLNRFADAMPDLLQLDHRLRSIQFEFFMPLAR